MGKFWETNREWFSSGFHVCNNYKGECFNEGFEKLYTEINCVFWKCGYGVLKWK